MGTSHKCADGTWKDGKALTCGTCAPKRKFRVGRYVRVPSQKT